MKASHLRVRYWRIVAFFARVTLSFILWEIVLPKFGFARAARAGRSRRNRATAVRFRALAIRMGGLMIKVGQFLSARLDILPPEITVELAGLQDEVPAVDVAVIRPHAERELGRSIDEHFAWFDAQPLAAASLGQVHRARLLPDDAAAAGFADVVVKIQRPYIEDIVAVDLAALRRVGTWLQRYKPVSRRADVPALVEEFAVTTLEEIDYLAEAGNAETFARHFEHDPRVNVPAVVWQLSTRRVLTLENVSAIRLGDYDAITAAGIDRAKVATVLLDVFMQQILEDGFFHADPHPGNIFVTPLDSVDADGNREWQLTFIDFGMMGRVPENLRVGLREMFIAIATQDGARLVQSFKTLDVLLPSADLKRIETASIQVFDRFGNMTLSELRNVDPNALVNFGLQFQELLLDLPFQLPENLLLLGRAVAILSGMCAGLDPDFNVWSGITPYAARLVGDEEQTTVSSVVDEATKLLQLLLSLPRRADRVLTQMERGELTIQTPRLDFRVQRVERAVQRQTLAIIAGALLISGALLRADDSGMSTGMLTIAAALTVRVLFTGGGGPGR